MLRDQRRGLQCLPGILYREPLRGELSKLVIDERQELRGRPRSARFIRGEDADDLRHKYSGVVGRERSVPSAM